MDRVNRICVCIIHLVKTRLSIETDRCDVYSLYVCRDRDHQSQLCLKVGYCMNLLRHISAYIKKGIISGIIHKKNYVYRTEPCKNVLMWCK